MISQGIMAYASGRVLGRGPKDDEHEQAKKEQFPWLVPGAAFPGRSRFKFAGVLSLYIGKVCSFILRSSLRPGDYHP